jgi:predicted alpha/beta superfamily hydrolase
MQGGRAAQYLTLLVDELMPEVNRSFRTLTGPAHTALVGSSLGGLVSLWIGLRRADVFGAVGAMSPSTWWDGRMILREVPAARGARMLRVWVDSGDSGPSRDGVDDTRRLADALRAAGYRDGESLRHVVQPGAAHNEAAWRSRLPEALRFLLGPREF